MENLSAVEAQMAATRCLDVMLHSHTFRVALRYSVHESLVMAAFCSVYLLKVRAAILSDFLMCNP